MAKMQGITGGLSGKMGSAVFRQRGGQTIATQYQPIVKNPNTEGQQEQRAKFKLMSQLAAIMQDSIGTLSVTKRKSKSTPSQRNAFTQVNFPLVSVVTDPGTGEVKASIPMEQLKLTTSFRAINPLTLNPTAGQIGAAITNVEQSITTVRMVLIGYKGIDGDTQAVVQQIVDVPNTLGRVSYSFTDLTEGNYTVLAYGLIPSQSANVKIDLDNIHTPVDEEFISAVKLNSMVEEGSMAVTMTVGENTAVRS